MQSIILKFSKRFISKGSKCTGYSATASTFSSSSRLRSGSGHNISSTSHIMFALAWKKCPCVPYITLDRLHRHISTGVQHCFQEVLVYVGGCGHTLSTAMLRKIPQSVSEMGNMLAKKRTVNLGWSLNQSSMMKTHVIPNDNILELLWLPFMLKNVIVQLI